MRLSEAIRLGSLAIRPVAKEILRNGGTEGCALGMGLVAVGGQKAHSPLTVWPWLSERKPRSYCYGYKIAALFDEQVMGGKMTLEALCDQVRAWEDDLESKGVNVEQVTMAATPETTHEPAAEHTEKVSR